MDKIEITPEKIYEQYDEGLKFNESFNLNNNVDNNENFYIGKQWEGVQSNGLPTPVFNFIKRIVNFQVASTSTDNIKINASPLPYISNRTMSDIERICTIMNAQFQGVWEYTMAPRKVRTFMRDAAVRCDGCMYTYFDPEADIGDGYKGMIRLEVLENTRVHFGNPTDRDVQAQPYIIIEKRMLVSEAQRYAEANDGNPNEIKADDDNTDNRFDGATSNKVTVLWRFERNPETGTIFCSVSTKNQFLREPWDTEQTLYPITWMSWDHVTNCYHGVGLVDGLIPNQVFVNRMFAMVYISLMTTAYPKIIYDKTRIPHWSSAVGAAIPVNGGDINSVAKSIDPATISPQVSEFIRMTVDMTKDLMGATDAALGSTRPDNTSAIIALQKASTVPVELVKQSFYQSIEELAKIWRDLMRVYYGKRVVGYTEDGMEEEFDFSTLLNIPIDIKLDVGGSAYWSEIAQIQTLDNLLMQNKISTSEYVKRLPSGYINLQNELYELLKKEEEQANMAQQAAMMGGMPPDIPMEGLDLETGTDAPIVDETMVEDEVPDRPGYSGLQRKINEQAAAGV